MHCVQGTTTSCSSINTAVITNIIKDNGVNVELSGTVEGDVGVNNVHYGHAGCQQKVKVPYPNRYPLDDGISMHFMY